MHENGQISPSEIQTRAVAMRLPMLRKLKISKGRGVFYFFSFVSNFQILCIHFLPPFSAVPNAACLFMEKANKFKASPVHSDIHLIWITHQQVSTTIYFPGHENASLRDILSFDKGPKFLNKNKASTTSIDIRKNSPKKIQKDAYKLPAASEGRNQGCLNKQSILQQRKGLATHESKCFRNKYVSAISPFNVSPRRTFISPGMAPSQNSAGWTTLKRAALKECSSKSSKALSISCLHTTSQIDIDAATSEKLHVNNTTICKQS